MKNLVAYWELKIVALVIALGLWQYTNGQVRIDKTIHVSVPDNAVQGLASGKFQVTGIEPREFTVHVSTPANLADSFRTDDLVPRLVVSAEALDSGKQDFPLGNRILGLNDDIRISFESDTPRTVTVTFDQVKEDYLPVELPTLEQVPAGLEASIALDRTQVLVAAPRSRLDELRAQGHRVRFLPVSLEHTDPRMSAPREERLHLRDHDPLVEVAEPVTAVIVLRPRQTTTRVVTVPVAILASHDLSHDLWSSHGLDLSPAQVTLTLRGPDNLLAALNPDTDLTAFIGLRRLPNQDQPVDLPVQMLAPAWLTWDPASVRVALTPTH